MHVRGNITCKFGEVAYSITERDHVYLEGGDLTYRGGAGYNVSLHLYRDGATWFIRNDYECSARRKCGNVSLFGESAIQAVMIAAWEEYINKSENQPLLRQAEINKLSREVADLDEKIVLAELALVKQRKHRNELQAQLDRT